MPPAFPFLVLLTLAWGGASVRDGAATTHKEEKGHVVSVKGPCGERPCCKPLSVTLPLKLEPKLFSPRMAIKLTVEPDGSIRKVEITKSSSVEDVDRQLREGAGRWCMEKTKEGREVDFMINLDVR
jgi:TonB family protein